MYLLDIYIFWKSKASYVPYKVNKVTQVNGSNNDDDNDDGTIRFKAADTAKTINGTLTAYVLKLMDSKCNKCEIQGNDKVVTTTTVSQI